jgi:hypothetical protein
MTVLVLGGCGVGDSLTEWNRDETEDPLTVTLYSDAQYDAVLLAFYGSNPQVEVNAQGRAGDHEAALAIGYRTIYCFPLDQIPAGATVTSATLSVPQVKVGCPPMFCPPTDPYADGWHGVLMAEQVVPPNSPTLEADDYFRGGGLVLGTVSTDATPGAKTIDATAAVQLDLQEGRSWSHFRIRFSGCDLREDTVCQNVELNTGEDHSPGPWGVPTLEVSYVP